MTQLWWENPNEPLTFSAAQEKLKPFSAAAAMGASALKMIYADLSRNGFINKRLRVPHKTKREYFWLFIFHIVFSCAALIIEITNGGLSVTSGVYYSWDVRLASFLLGFIFLLLYYKR